MLAVLSPAKTLDYERTHLDTPETRHRFPDETAELVAHAQKLSVVDIAKLMHISEPLAQLNYDRFQGYADLPERAAIHAFDGDVYDGLGAGTFDNGAFLFAQDHLRILSGLYGLLRPFDLMKPYRLEMGTKRFPFENKVSLWWRDRIAKVITADAWETGDGVILNLASQEYWAACKGRLGEGVRVVDVEFLAADGRFITMHAKTARGVMARWMIENRVTDVEGMKGFDADGYAFDPEASTPDAWTFRRAA